MSWDHPGVRGGEWGGISQVSLAHPVMDLLMGCQGPHHQVRIALGASDPLVESLPVSDTLYCHPEAVGIHIVSH